jgi:hypothetical protein
MTILSNSTPPDVVARVALDSMTDDLAGLDMKSWANRVHGEGLAPDDTPSVCGSTLCAAGWVAHSLGWRVYPGGDCVRDDDPGEFIHVSDVAEAALRISPVEGGYLWYMSVENVLKQFARLADGLSLDLPVDDEEERDTDEV